jgi:hypothetical protein
MKIHQLSLFLENQPGQMIEPCRLLAGAGIDIRSLSLADTRQFGILRAIVSDWQATAKVLEDAGYVVNTTEVVVIEAEDRPGGDDLPFRPAGRGDRAPEASASMWWAAWTCTTACSERGGRDIALLGWCRLGL